MKERFDLYSATGPSLEDVKRLLSQALAIEFELHSSFYLGGDYYLWEGDGHDEVKILVNTADEEGYLLESQRPVGEILVYASSLADPAFDLLQHLPDLELRRSEII